MPRTIVVGDIHGCREELERLLEHVGLSAGDRLVSVGDAVVRGPDPHGTLALLRSVGAVAVRGNHEDRLLRWRATRGSERRFTLGGVTKKTARALTKRDWEWLEQLPLWLDLDEHGLRVVHAGIIPGVPMQLQVAHTLLYIRSIGRFGQPLEERGKTPWGKLYHGPPHIVFGHNALPEPQVHPWATGIDTGAVYGGRLTAMVLRAGEHPPPPSWRKEVLVSVPSRRKYYAR
jgi:hypothetical protein